MDVLGSALISLELLLQQQPTFRPHVEEVWEGQILMRAYGAPRQNRHPHKDLLTGLTLWPEMIAQILP
ncbi:unannotated protein [freshwater metagenome]|uniref:Unannotated protein n=1 Tax=freshwater metagenome TaxID=449393 RepID=A0A6J6MQ95_9ZZZZ